MEIKIGYRKFTIVLVGLLLFFICALVAISIVDKTVVAVTIMAIGSGFASLIGLFGRHNVKEHEAEQKNV